MTIIRFLNVMKGIKMKPEDYRKDQAENAKRIGSTSSRTSYAKPTDTVKRPFVAKGHDAILKDAQDARGLLRIITMSDGANHTGKMVARDKFTITIEIPIDADTGTSVRRTFYKHAIESFERI